MLFVFRTDSSQIYVKTRALLNLLAGYNPCYYGHQAQDGYRTISIVMTSLVFLSWRQNRCFHRVENHNARACQLLCVGGLFSRSYNQSWWWNCSLVGLLHYALLPLIYHAPSCGIFNLFTDTLFHTHDRTPCKTCQTTRDYSTAPKHYNAMFACVGMVTCLHSYPRWMFWQTRVPSLSVSVRDTLLVNVGSESGLVCWVGAWCSR